MLTKYGDMFANIKNGQVIAHGCNAQGVMGSGVAAAVKAQFPEAYNVYSRYVRSSGLGKVISVETKGIWVANCITQEFYGRDHSKRYVSYDAVYDCFEELANHFKDKVVNFPLIGGGLGNGDPDVLKYIFELHFPEDNGVLWLLEGN